MRLLVKCSTICQLRVSVGAGQPVSGLGELQRCSVRHSSRLDISAIGKLSKRTPCQLRYGDITSNIDGINMSPASPRLCSCVAGDTYAVWFALNAEAPAAVAGLATRSVSWSYDPQRDEWVVVPPCPSRKLSALPTPLPTDGNNLV
jgi:hypothetical protein